jgi:hypothetical protein
MSAVQKIEPRQEIVAAQPVTPMEMLAQAVEKGASIDVLTKLMDLQERWEKNQSRKTFEAALAAARADFKPIVKGREVDFTSQKGRTHYRYEDLGGIANAVDPILAKHGLSYRYRTTSNINEPITVTCIVFGHGHSEENTLSAGRDESGNKNSIQAVSSTVTYLQRYTLKAALGIAASNDDDGRGADTSGGATITDDQVDEIRELLAKTGGNELRFLKSIKLESLTQISADKFERAKSLISSRAQA